MIEPENSGSCGLPESWLKYGLPGIDTVNVRNRIIPLIENYCSENGINRNGVTLTAGAACFIVWVDVLLTEKQKGEIKQIVMENSPPDHSCHLIDETNT